MIERFQHTARGTDFGDAHYILSIWEIETEG